MLQCAVYLCNEGGVLSVYSMRPLGNPCSTLMLILEFRENFEVRFHHIFFHCQDPAASVVLFLELSEACYLFYFWPDVARTVANHFVCTAKSSTAVPCVCGAA